MTTEESNLASKKRRARQFQLAKALWKNGGSISKACETTGVSRQTHYNWYWGDSFYRNLVERVVARLDDNLNKDLSDRVRADIESGDEEAIETARMIWGEKVLNRIKAGQVHDFNYVGRTERLDAI